MADHRHIMHLIDDAKAYAHRRARREHTEVRVYARSGIVYVRAIGEPQPDYSEIIYSTSEESTQ